MSTLEGDVYNPHLKGKHGLTYTADTSHHLLDEKVAILEGEYKGRVGIVIRINKESSVVIVSFGKETRPYHLHQVRHASRDGDTN